MKNLSISVLCDVYGELLTEKQLQSVRLYYDDDLSLAEIAEITGISRQAVHYTITQAEEQLLAYEKKVGAIAEMCSLYSALDEISKSLRSSGKDNEEIQNLKNGIRSKYGAFFITK